MRLIFLFRRFMFALVMMGIVAFCMAEGNLSMLLIVGGFGALSWYVTEGPNGQPLSRWMINLASIGAVIWLLFDLYWQTWHVIITMGHFMMWLQIILLYAHKSNREYGQLLVLSLMQMIGASVLSVSMVYGAMLVGYCALAVVTLLLFQLKSTSDRVLQANRAAVPAGKNVGPPKAIMSRGHRWHFRLLVITLSLFCGGFATIIFILIPRTGDAHLPGHVANPLTSPRVGFSQQVDLSTSPSSQGGKEPVLKFQIMLNGHDVGSEEMHYLLRGAVLDYYDHRKHTWTRSHTAADQDRSVPLPSQGTTLAEIETDTPQLEAIITLRRSRYRTLFTVWPTSHVSSPHISEVDFNPIDLQLSARESTAGDVIYTLRCPLSPPRNMSRRYTTQFPITRHLPTPPRLRGIPSRFGAKPQFSTTYARWWPVQLDRIRDLAKNVLTKRGIKNNSTTTPGTSNEHIVTALSEFLTNEFRYNLSNPRTHADQDPVVQFLFDQRQGHCELFASALAAMCRSIGLPARVITGYRASEYNRIGGYYVVRRSHAHSWTEVDLGPGLGWRPFDATPPDEVRAEHAVQKSWLTSVRELYEHMEFAWIKLIISYDQHTRQAVLDNINHSIVSSYDDEKGWIGQIVSFARGLSTLWRNDQISYSLAGFIIVMIVIGIGSLMRTLVVHRRRLAALQIAAVPWSRRKGLTRRLRFYLIMLDMLERHGFVRPRWQSPLHFAQQLVQKHPQRLDAVLNLTEQFYEIRFGHRDLDLHRQQQIQSQLKLLENALSRRQ